MANRERAFFRAVYETFYRANELLQCNIEDYNKKTGELIALHTKNKYNPKTKQYIKSAPKDMILSNSTQILFKRIIGNRKKGPIFINKKGERLTKTYFQVVINEIATSIGIQKVTHVTETGKEYHLVTLKALREAGERHCDLAGADSEVTARASQHSAMIKEKHYKKTGWDEVQEQVKKYHPAFKED
jgi:integrase